MNDRQRLEQLKPIADEMLAGLRADGEMKRRILEAANRTSPKRAAAHARPRARRAFVPALCCCAALAVVCVGALARTGKQPAAVQIETLHAGVGEAPQVQLIAGLGDGASVRTQSQAQTSLFAGGESDMPLVSLGGAVYRMLAAPERVPEGMLGETLGAVTAHAEEPSLASEAEMEAGLSNVAESGAEIRALAGVNAATAVAAPVGGAMRVFQRVSYAGRGPGGLGLEDVFDVRGKAARVELSDVGALTGDAANTALAALLDGATLVSQDASVRGRTLTVTLENGLSLQLGVSGDTLSGCGAWSCPEFFEAFEAAL